MNAMPSFDSFTNLYSLSKTLRFELIPQGKTKETFEAYIKAITDSEKDDEYIAREAMEGLAYEGNLLAQDKIRDTDYKIVKKVFDEYHRDFIKKALEDFELKVSDNDEGSQDSLEAFDLFYRVTPDKEVLKSIQTNLRKAISSRLTQHPDYNNLYGKELFGVGTKDGTLVKWFKEKGDAQKATIIQTIKEDLKLTEIFDVLKSIQNFKGFSTYFGGFHENRKNMYSDEVKATAIAHRLIHENLPTFIDNTKIIRGRLLPTLENEETTELREKFTIQDTILKTLASLESFNTTLTQAGINNYNESIGKINSYINEYNQRIAKTKDEKIWKLDMLYKQILSDSEGGLKIDKFDSDQEVLDSIRGFYGFAEQSIFPQLKALVETLKNYSADDLRHIYLQNNLSLKGISKSYYGSYDTIQKALERYYDVHYDEIIAAQKKRIDDLNRQAETAGTVKKKIGAKSDKDKLSAIQPESLLNVFENIADKDWKLKTGLNIFQIKEILAIKDDTVLNVFKKSTKSTPTKYDPEAKKDQYEEQRKKYLDNQDTFSMRVINEGLALLDDDNVKGKENIAQYFLTLGKADGDTPTLFELIEDIYTRHDDDYDEEISVKELLVKPYADRTKKKLAQELGGKKIKNEEEVVTRGNTDKLKLLLDAIKALQRFVKPLACKEFDRNVEFYAEFEKLMNGICPDGSEIVGLNTLNKLYDMTRNYVTQKPYSTDKILLNFDRTSLLKWSLSDYGIIFQKIVDSKAYYYLGIPVRKDVSKKLDEAPRSDNDVVSMMGYQQTKAGQLVQNLLRINNKVEKAKPSKNVIASDDSIEVNGNKIYGKSRNGIFEVEIEGEVLKLKIGDDGKVNVKLEQMKTKHLPSEINSIRKQGSYNAGVKFNKRDLIKFVDYYKSLICEYQGQQFEFKSSEKYNNFKEFTDHIDKQAYQLTLDPISWEHLDKLASRGEIFLFQIYCKDFSQHSEGTPNMHTLYWKMLFDANNRNKASYKLDGEGAKMFFRKASIKPTPTHLRNHKIANKFYTDKQGKTIRLDEITIRNLNTYYRGEKRLEDLTQKEREYIGNCFDFMKGNLKEDGIIKDKRYSENKYHFHVPITLNFSSEREDNINKRVLEHLSAKIKENKDIHIIGIDRGERHLLYLSLIRCKSDGTVKIVEQRSLNEIVNRYKGKEYKVDYRTLLDNRENERKAGRESWSTIENIGELKEGYASQVIHLITEWMVKYEAIVVLEKLSKGFMDSRKRVEKSVYTRFETALVEKLKYLILDKKAAQDDPSKMLSALQLVNNAKYTENDKQSGFLFYVPAAYTSKIDPTTGFISLFDCRYDSVESAKSFLGKFYAIRCNKDENYFEFEVTDYTQFNKKAESMRQHWIICTHGKRIETFRNPEKNNQWDHREIDLTNEFKSLFNKYGINLESDLKSEIAKQEKSFFYNDGKDRENKQKGLLQLLKFTLQMRNSVTGTDIDYLISPVAKNGVFYDSRNKPDNLPHDADANGAYNIARKGLILINRLYEKGLDGFGKNMKGEKGKPSQWLPNDDWFAFAQKQHQSK